MIILQLKASVSSDYRRHVQNGTTTPCPSVRLIQKGSKRLRRLFSTSLLSASEATKSFRAPTPERLRPMKVVQPHDGNYGLTLSTMHGPPPPLGSWLSSHASWPPDRRMSCVRSSRVASQVVSVFCMSVVRPANFHGWDGMPLPSAASMDAAGAC